MKVKTDFVPEDCDYIAVGKVYETIVRVIEGVYSITDDDGETICIRLEGCAYIGNNPWTIVEE